MPNRDHSSAIPAAKVSSADRAIDEWIIIGIPRRGLNPRNAMNPERAGIIHRAATRWVTSHVASRFSRCTARIPFSSVRSSGAANWPPALLIRWSTRSYRSPTASMNAATCSGSRTSHGIAKAGVAELLDRVAQRLLAPTAERDARAGRDERARRRPPDPGPAAGDDRDLARERVGRQRRRGGRGYHGPQVWTSAGARWQAKAACGSPCARSPGRTARARRSSCTMASRRRSGSGTSCSRAGAPLPRGDLRCARPRR